MPSASPRLSCGPLGVGTPEPPVPPKASTLLHSACGFKDQLAHGAAPGVCRIIQNLARMGIKRICLCACGLRVHHSGVGVGVPTGLSLPTPSCVMSVGGASAPPPPAAPWLPPAQSPCTVPHRCMPAPGLRRSWSGALCSGFLEEAPWSTGRHSGPRPWESLPSSFLLLERPLPVEPRSSASLPASTPPPTPAQRL